MVNKGAKLVLLFQLFIYPMLSGIIFILVSMFSGKSSGPNIFMGLCLGVLNFANIALYVKAHMIFKETPAIVFAGMNILVVLIC